MRSFPTPGRLIGGGDVIDIVDLQDDAISTVERCSV